ncbi:hypothetical protein Tco_0656093 [Tanacetum coccineum]|uniref:Uncharacterized protein n=1 Tax=Tanacetum coccineum TaxID=301880 RepID=A0ABQ4X7U1_9ASTR
METCDPVGSPMEIKDKLDLDQHGSPVDETKYHSMIGALMYLTICGLLLFVCPSPLDADTVKGLWLSLQQDSNLTVSFGNQTYQYRISATLGVQHSRTEHIAVPLPCS